MPLRAIKLDENENGWKITINRCNGILTYYKMTNAKIQPSHLKKPAASLQWFYKILFIGNFVKEEIENKCHNKMMRLKMNLRNSAIDEKNHLFYAALTTIVRFIPFILFKIYWTTLYIWWWYWWYSTSFHAKYKTIYSPIARDSSLKACKINEL